jgi:hypothetical protein
VRKLWWAVASLAAAAFLVAGGLEDCVATTSQEEHENAIKFDYPMFSDVMTSGTLAEQLVGWGQR